MKKRKKISNILISAFLVTMTNQLPANVFENHPLPETLQREMVAKKTWNADCPVPLERLRVVKFSYYDFAGIEHQDGEFVVLDAAADQLLKVMQKLHTQQFPLHKARSIEHYDGNDEASMADNNSSCFNCREITGGGLPSIHAYGLAIDINPIQNPFLGPHEKQEGLAKVLPAAGLAYLNRTNIRPGMAEHIKEIFTNHGFSIWGGGWNDPIDWQHFQPSRATAQLLAAMVPQDARILFEMYAQEPRMLNAVDPKDNTLVELYQKDPIQFMQQLKENPGLLQMKPLEAYQALEIKK